MYRDFWRLFAVVLVFYVAAGLVHASTTSSSFTWRPSTESGFNLDVTYPLCQTATGNITFNATVTGATSGSTVVDANVYATIRKPDSSTFDINFTNDLSGTYAYTQNLDQNGTYFIQAHAFKTSLTPGDWNGYIYVRDLNWTTQFVNNGFDLNIGENGSIRNIVTNIDGNRVFDINANTTIYYPDTTVADANAVMSQTSTGEFVHTFFGPSPAGDYTVSTLFTCGALKDHNAAGTFTVLPNPDTNTGGGTGGSGGSGSSGGTGGGGGGGAGGGAGPRAKIVEIVFEPTLGRNAPSLMEITVQNLTAGITDYTVVYTFTTPSGATINGEKDILDVGPYGVTTVTLDSAYTPFETGVYTLRAELFKMNTITKYDTYLNSYNVQGSHSVALDVAPSSDKTAVGLSFPFSINLLNDGDFIEKNIHIEWYLLNPNGDEYLRSTLDTELRLGESASRPFSPFIPINEKLGLHQLVVEMRAYNVTQIKTIVFTVASPNDYYAQVIQDLELRIDQIDEKLDDLEGRGFDVADAQITLLDIKTDLARAKGMLLAGEFDSLNGELIDLSGRVTRLAAEIDALEQQSPLLSREGLNLILYVGAAILLGLFAWLLYWLLEKEKQERGKRGGVVILPPSPTWLTSILGVQKCYILASERERLKRKPLIDRIIGLIEGESSHDND